MKIKMDNTMLSDNIDILFYYLFACICVIKPFFI